ncbi:MAG: proprotein convertase P-domain-containing protein [Deltaproteobacteria bacterium]|nr:proprotein convertase P-domain-containing protein [Deltaproteobacteria bacterium]
MRLHSLLAFALLWSGCEAPPERLPVDAGTDAAPAPDAGGADGLRVTTAALADGEWGAVYSFELEAAGGERPYSWSVVGGLLPSNTWLQPEGRVVSPALGEDGQFGVVIEVADAVGSRARRALPFRVLRHLALSTGSLPRAYVGRAYAAAVVAVGGRPPYRIELARGALPDGLALDEHGRIAGTPAREGVEDLGLRVTDASGQVAEGEATLAVLGPIAVVDDAVHDVRFCFARRLFGLEVADLFQVESVAVALRVVADDPSRLVITLISPAGTEVYLRDGPGDEEATGELDVVFGAAEPTAEPLDVLAGEPARGLWTLTLYDPRCPYPATVQEIALVFADRRGTEDTSRVEGWTASLEAGRPSVRVAGGGIDQSTIALEVVRYSVGPNGIAEGGAGDDLRQGALPARWTTTLDPAVATLDEETGVLTAGEATGAGELRWEAQGASGTLPVLVLPPDWVP